MDIKIKNLDYREYAWEMLEYGDVCEFISKDGCQFIGMKVDSSLDDDFLLDLNDSKIYTDIKNYQIVRIVKNPTLVGE